MGRDRIKGCSRFEWRRNDHWPPLLPDCFASASLSLDKTNHADFRQVCPPFADGAFADATFTRSVRSTSQRQLRTASLPKKTVVLERMESAKNLLEESNSYSPGGIEVFGQARTAPNKRPAHLPARSCTEIPCQLCFAWIILLAVFGVPALPSSSPRSMQLGRLARPPKLLKRPHGRGPRDDSWHMRSRATPRRPGAACLARHSLRTYRCWPARNG
jgi:hypothetical protein